MALSWCLTCVPVQMIGRALVRAMAFNVKVDRANAGGAVPKVGQTVQVHYTGWLQGKGPTDAFDSSRSRGRPFEFKLGVGQVIKAWDQGVVR